MKIKDFKRKLEIENPEIASIVANDLGYQIGKRVELARILKGLTQTELANKVGTKQSSISRIESGASLPSLSFLVKVAEALDTTLTAPDFSSLGETQNKKFNFRAHSSETVSDTLIQSPYFTSGATNSSKIIFN